jgi:hypothetical protein
MRSAGVCENCMLAAAGGILFCFRIGDEADHAIDVLRILLDAMGLARHAEREDWVAKRVRQSFPAQAGLADKRSEH